jgi:MerR family transcriptional regulator, light-induced transcriptional regulator
VASPASSSSAHGDRLRQQQAAIAAALVDRQFSERPELAVRYGPIGREKCLQDANYHLAYLADAMSAETPALFGNYVAWAKVMLGKRNIPEEDLARHLELTRTMLRETLAGDTGALAVEYVSAGLAQLQSFPVDLPTCLSEDALHAGLAFEYLAALLKGERHVASKLVVDAAAAGTPVREIYLHVFQAAQYEVGRLWQINEITVAQEHYCTAAAQLIMSQLYPYVFASEKTEGTLVATCVAGDLHEIGIRMVTDFFEMDGWNTYYLGASTPAQAVVDTVVQHQAQVLAISATILGGLRGVDELIHRVRAQPACRDVKILVGGYPFLVAPELWERVGADGTAANAQDAIALAGRLAA